MCWCAVILASDLALALTRPFAALSSSFDRRRLPREELQGPQASRKLPLSFFLDHDAFLELLQIK